MSHGGLGGGDGNTYVKSLGAVAANGRGTGPGRGHGFTTAGIVALGKSLDLSEPPIARPKACLPGS